MQYRPHRYPTQYPIKVRTAHGPQQGEVIDVNHGGARIAGLSHLRRGEKIQIDVLSHRIEAVVLWSKRDQTGVLFRPQISDHHLDTLRQRRDMRRTHQRGRVGFAFAEMR